METLELEKEKIAKTKTENISGSEAVIESFDC